MNESKKQQLQESKQIHTTSEKHNFTHINRLTELYLLLPSVTNQNTQKKPTHKDLIFKYNELLPFINLYPNAPNSEYCNYINLHLEAILIEMSQESTNLHL